MTGRVHVIRASAVPLACRSRSSASAPYQVRRKWANGRRPTNDLSRHRSWSLRRCGSGWLVSTCRRAGCGGRYHRCRCGRKAETSGSLRERSPGSRSGCGGRGGNGFAWAALLRM